MVDYSEDLPWFPLDARRWLVGTAGMTKAEKGVFIDLLCYQWTNGPLSRSPSRLPIECAEEWEYLKSKFIENEEGLVNRRLHKIRLEKESLLDKQREGGKKGARSRYGSPGGSAIGSKNQSKNQNQSKISESDSEPEKKEAATDVTATYTELAQRFLEKQQEAFPKESAWKDFEARVTDGAKKLHLFHTQNDWTEKEIRDLLAWVVADDFWSRNIRTLGGIRDRKKGGPMKFENARAAMPEQVDEKAAEREVLESRRQQKEDEKQAAPQEEAHEAIQGIVESLQSPAVGR